MTAIQLLCDGTTRAAIHMMREQHIEPEAGKLSLSCKRILKANVAEIMEEWKEATEARISEIGLRNIMNVQCHALGVKVMADYLGE